MENQERNIEDRQISGITAKQLVFYFGGIITIIVTIMMNYLSLRSEIRENNQVTQQIQAQNINRDKDREEIKQQIQILKLDIAIIKVKLEVDRVK